MVREAQFVDNCQSWVLSAGKTLDLRGFWNSAVLGDREPNARNLETQRAQRTAAESAETNIPRIGRLIVVTGLSGGWWRARQTFRLPHFFPFSLPHFLPYTFVMRDWLIRVLF